MTIEQAHQHLRCQTTGRCGHCGDVVPPSPSAEDAATRRDLMHALTRRREQLGLTRAAVANQVGTTEQGVVRFEAHTGDTSYVPLADYQAYAAAVGTSLMFIERDFIIHLADTIRTSNAVADTRNSPDLWDAGSKRDHAELFADALEAIPNFPRAAFIERACGWTVDKGAHQ